MDILEVSAKFNFFRDCSWSLTWSDMTLHWQMQSGKRFSLLKFFFKTIKFFFSRRLILSDVPTMAIEKVHMYQNTSIMQVDFTLCFTDFSWDPFDSVADPDPGHEQ